MSPLAPERLEAISGFMEHERPTEGKEEATEAVSQGGADSDRLMIPDVAVEWSRQGVSDGKAGRLMTVTIEDFEKARQTRCSNATTEVDSCRGANSLL